MCHANNYFMPWCNGGHASWMGCHDRARADAGRYEMEWAGICDTSGVGGASLHGLNELGVSLLVGEIDS